MLGMALFRKPDFVIYSDADGKKPNLKRWYILPRSYYFNCYLHQFVGSDKRTPHDHPWWSLSITLWGGGKEKRYKDGKWKLNRLYPGRIFIRSAAYTHRVVIEAGPVWTLFITGPAIRSWGFWEDGEFIPWREFCDPEDKGRPKRDEV